MGIWSKCGALLLLAGSLLQDAKNKNISVKWLLLNALTALLAAYFTKMQLSELAAGLLPGAFLFLAAFATHGRIGKGDAGVVLILGMYLGMWGSLTVLLFGCSLSALFGVCMVLSRRFSPKRYMIFSPFLCAGYIIWRLLCMTEELQ